MRVMAWLGAALVVVLAITVAAVAFPGAWLPSLAESRLQDRLGREVQVGGADITFSPFKVSLTEVKVANPDWAEHDWLLETDRLETWPKTSQLLSGSLAFDRVKLEQPTVHLARSDTGTTWSLGGAGQGQGGPPIDRLEVTGGQFTYRNDGANSLLSGSFASRPEQDRLHVAATGAWRGSDARLEGWTARLLDLRLAETIPIGFDVTIGRTWAMGEGTISGLDAPRGPFFTVDMTASGPSLAAWDRIADVGLPSTPPYDLEGRLSWDGKAYAFQEAGGTIGDSDVEGGIRVSPGPVTQVSGTIDGGHMTLDDVLAVVGSGPDGGQRDLLPGDLAVDLSVSAGRLLTGWRPLDEVETQVVLEDRHLSLDPFAASAGGGRVSGRLDLDAAVQPPRAGGRLSLEGMELVETLGSLELTAGGIEGRYGGTIELAGDWTGSFGQWLGSLDGQVELLVSDGRLGTDRLKKAGFGLQDLFGGGDEPATIRCAVLEAPVENGVAKARTAVLSTPAALVSADGTLDLGALRWDLTVHVEPREGSGIGVVDDVRVTGPLTDPEVDTDIAAGELAARGVAGVALAALATPLAVLVPLLGAGADDAPGCHAILTRVQQAERPGAQRKGQQEEAD